MPLEPYFYSRVSPGGHKILAVRITVHQYVVPVPKVLERKVRLLVAGTRTRVAPVARPVRVLDLKTNFMKTEVLGSFSYEDVDGGMAY